jgi:mono/diheme cytochrome c family protein
VFKNYCSNCHSTSSETIIVGPSLVGIATRGGDRIEGMDAQTYIRDSILNPNAYTVENYPQGIMPLNMVDALSSEDLDAVVAYLLTLK